MNVEITVMKHLRSKYLNPLIEAYILKREKEDEIHIVSDYASGGDLSKYFSEQ